MNKKVEWKELKTDIEQKKINCVKLEQDSKGYISSVRLYLLKDELMAPKGENVLEMISVRPRRMYDKEVMQKDDETGLYIEKLPDPRNPTFKEFQENHEIFISMAKRIEKHGFVNVVLPVKVLEKTEDGKKDIFQKVETRDIDKIQIA